MEPYGDSYKVETRRELEKEEYHAGEAISPTSIIFGIRRNILRGVHFLWRIMDLIPMLHNC